MPKQELEKRTIYIYRYLGQDCVCAEDYISGGLKKGYSLYSFECGYDDCHGWTPLNTKGEMQGLELEFASEKEFDKDFPVYKQEEGLFMAVSDNGNMMKEFMSRVMYKYGEKVDMANANLKKAIIDMARAVNFDFKAEVVPPEKPDDDEDD